ncbi:MAG: hypothetical protein ACT4PL_03945 [Phycisphaerales bacterium]
MAFVLGTLPILLVIGLIAVVAANTPEEPPPTDRCAICGYSLTAIPRDGPCPECGKDGPERVCYAEDKQRRRAQRISITRHALAFLLVGPFLVFLFMILISWIISLLVEA